MSPFGEWIPMRNPLWRLKTLPWITLLQNAFLTVLVATLLDIALLVFLSFIGSGFQSDGFRLLGGGVGGTLLVILVAGGVGALAVVLMERFFRQVILDTATLWALVGCLALILFLKSRIPVIPGFLVGFSQMQIVGVVLGLFAQGRTYWR